MSYSIKLSSSDRVHFKDSDRGPCVATNYNKFPEGAVVITEPKEFTKLTGYLC